jgi:chorismate lyase/3-hydroxybenzoate synthase
MRRSNLQTAAALPFTALYGQDAQAHEWLEDDHLLAVIRFQQADAMVRDPRLCEVALPQLEEAPVAEFWISPWPVRIGVSHGAGYAENGRILFLQIRLDEYAGDALQPLTAVAYRRLFAAARARGYPHFLRIWNYFPNINQECSSLERYRSFCAGRHQALMAELAECETHLPAACALGAVPPSPDRDVGSLHLYALAAREPGQQIENPRQVSAFHYPPQYGQRSPSFSRAVLKAWSERDYHLYISGTASIVGHDSQHTDLMAQLDETLLNLETLLTHAGRSIPVPLQLELLKIYCRSDVNTAPLRARIAQAFGTDAPMLFLRADICRRELLIEIEGMAVGVAR